MFGEQISILGTFICQLMKYVIPLYAVIGTRPNFPHIKYGGLERPHESGKRSYRYVKSRLKHNAAEFQSIKQFLACLNFEHRFTAKKIKNVFFNFKFNKASSSIRRCTFQELGLCPFQL